MTMTTRLAPLAPGKGAFVIHTPYIRSIIRPSLANDTCQVRPFSHLSTHPLPPIVSPIAVRVAPSCRIRGSKGKRRNRQGDRRAGKDNSANNSLVPNQARDDSAKELETNGEDDEFELNMNEDLSQLFQEDVKEPLRADGSSRRGKKRGGSGGAEGMGKKLSGQLSAAVPKNREDMLNLLVRGAWLGIFGLVALFFSVHLLITRDWLPGGN